MAVRCSPAGKAGKKPLKGNPDPSAKVTIRTVARDAGVSVAAVSKVLRSAYGVSPGLRERVMASIEKLGYRPNKAARGCAGRTHGGRLGGRDSQPLRASHCRWRPGGLG